MARRRERAPFHRESQKNDSPTTRTAGRPGPLFVSDCRSVVGEIDADGNGRIIFSEFSQAMKRKREQMKKFERHAINSGGGYDDDV